jgi:hypothetical protein
MFEMIHVHVDAICRESVIRYMEVRATITLPSPSEPVCCIILRDCNIVLRALCGIGVLKIGFAKFVRLFGRTEVLGNGR